MKPYIKYLISLTNSHFLGNQTPLPSTFYLTFFKILSTFQSDQNKKIKNKKLRRRTHRCVSRRRYFSLIFRFSRDFLVDFFLLFLCEFSVSSCRQILKMGLSIRLVLYILRTPWVLTVTFCAFTLLPLTEIVTDIR